MINTIIYILEEEKKLVKNQLNELSSELDILSRYASSDYRVMIDIKVLIELLLNELEKLDYADFIENHLLD